MNWNRYLVATLLVIAPFLSAFINPPQAYAYSNPATVPLLTVANFAALAKSAITNPVAGTVLNNGDMGLDSPATCTGFPSPCTGVTTNGTINNGVIQYQNAVALQGQTDATAAVTNIGLRTSNETLSTAVGGLTLTQGVYTIAHDATANITGDLTLNGDADSVFIFHLTSDFVTANGSRVLLTGGAQACNVFWKVDSSATFNGNTQMVGTVLAQTSVDFPAGGATLDGRIIAQTGAITFRNTTVNNTSCATTTTSSSSSVGSTTLASQATAPEYFCPTIPIGITAPNIIDSRRIDSDSIFLSWGPYSGTDQFIVRYGFTNGDWMYSTNVTGFSTTINSLPANTPIWVEVAVRNDCQVGNFGQPALVGVYTPIGGPKLPNTGFEPKDSRSLWYLIVTVFLGISVLLVSILKKY